MKLLLTGLSHHTAPLEVRERMVFDADSLPHAMRRVREMAPAVEELLLLSTCNRTELVLRSSDPAASAAQVRSFLGEKSGIDRGRLESSLYTLHDEEAVRHLFRVAASLDSMVIGEPQILKQVKDAHSGAIREGHLGTVLDGLCRRAIQTAKRVRTETAIGRNPVSISYTACELARQIFGNLKGCTVLVIGAGKMSELTLRHLVSAGADTILVTARRYERAMAVARQFNGKAVSFDRLAEVLPEVDIVVSSTAAPHILLTKDDVLDLMKKRRNRPVFLIDIAVPRDIDPAANEVANAYLYDLDDLQGVVDENLQERKVEAADGERIVEAEVRSFERWYSSLAAGPTIAAMRGALHDLRQDEFERFRSRLNSLSPEQMGAVEEFGRGLVNKILHLPMRELKRVGDGGRGEGQTDLVRRLFGLGAHSEPTEEPEEEEVRKDEDLSPTGRTS